VEEEAGKKRAQGEGGGVLPAGGETGGGTREGQDRGRRAAARVGRKGISPSFFLMMYAHRHTLLILINIMIHSWYIYK
jgi:hypothetical protein